jgi:hypothetical protein
MNPLGCVTIGGEDILGSDVFPVATGNILFVGNVTTLFCIVATGGIGVLILETDGETILNAGD